MIQVCESRNKWLIQNNFSFKVQFQGCPTFSHYRSTFDACANSLWAGFFIPDKTRIKLSQKILIQDKFMKK